MTFFPVQNVNGLSSIERPSRADGSELMFIQNTGGGHNPYLRSRGKLGHYLESFRVSAKRSDLNKIGFDRISTSEQQIPLSPRSS